MGSITLAVILRPLKKMVRSCYYWWAQANMCLLIMLKTPIERNVTQFFHQTSGVDVTTAASLAITWPAGLTASIVIMGFVFKRFTSPWCKMAICLGLQTMAGVLCFIM